MIEGDVATIRNDAIDKLELARLEHQGAVPFVESAQLRVRKLGKHPIVDVVLVDRDNPEPPPRATKILRVGIHTDRILGKFSQQRAEVLDKGSVYVVRE